MRGSRIIYFLFLTILYLPSTSVLMSQNNPRIFQHFKSDNGLAQNNISCINQDKEGYMWISNEDGINRFDGHNCKLIMSHDSVSKHTIHAEYLLKDHNGKIWIANSVQLMRYDPLTEKIIYLSDDENYKNAIGRVDVTSLAEDESGMMWIGTRHGLYQYDDKKKQYTHFLHDTVGTGNYAYFKNRVRDLLYDKHGTLWVATISGLFKFSIRSHQFISVFKTADDPNLNKDDVLSMTFDKTGNIWISITDGGIRVIDTATSKLTYINTITTNNQLNSNNVGKLLCDRNGNIWISHFTKGINIYHPQTKEFESYRHDESDSHSLGDDRTTTLFEDKNGMMWIGTLSEGADGVSAISPKFNPYILHPGKPNTLCEQGITCAAEDRSGNLWIGSENGLMYFDRSKNSFSCFHHEDNKNNSLAYDYIQAVKVDKNGILWVGTRKGLNKYDPVTGKWKLYIMDMAVPESFPSDIINGICERSNGELWFSCNNGVCRYVPDKDCFENSFNNATIRLLVPEFYMALFEDSKKMMWVSTSRNGVYQLDDSFKIIHYYRYDKTKSNVIPSNIVNEFAEDKDGNIWMATYNGLCKLNVKTQQFKVYTADDGLPSNMIAQVKIADDGTVWLGSSIGLTQLFFDKQGKMFVKNFSVSDGLQSNVFYTGSLKLHTGELFFGGSKGFNLFKPERSNHNGLVPEVKISSFSIFDKEYDYMPMYHLLNKIRLDYKQNFFSFDMAAMSFDYPGKNQYAYQLEGFDKNMIYCGTQNHASYTNVPPGVYTLHVIASNNDGLWNKEGIRIQIEITPPFWKTWWFITISSLISVLLSAFLIRYIFNRRLRKELIIIEQQREIENIRSRISRDIHDEIGSGLTRISLLSEMVRSNADKKNADAPLLEKIILSSRQISSSLSEIIWAVNPEHDNLESLLAYMRHYINNFFEDSVIKYKIDFPDDVTDNDHVNPDIKRNLFLILKESLNNIVKHAQAKNVIVTFIVQDKKFKLTISDDGAGIAEEKKSGFGNGLRNIHSRAESINAACTIRSYQGVGTSVEIEGKLDDNQSKRNE